MTQDAHFFRSLSEARKMAYACAVLVALVFAIYWPLFHAEFIDFDDNTHVFRNPVVLAGFSFTAVWAAFSQFIASQWIPLTWISHMVDVQLFGLNPGWHHLENVAFHALNSCLVLAALNSLTRKFWPSAAVAVLFAVHPANVESVAWIAERKNLLSTMFWLLAMLAYARHVADARPRWMALVAASMALGLMAKPVLVTLPCALLLLDVWPLQRKLPWWKLIWEKAALFLLSLISSGITLMAAAHFRALLSVEKLPFSARLMNALVAYAAYLRLVIWPTDLAVMYPIQPAQDGIEVGIAVLLMIAVTAALWQLRHRAPSAFVGWLWFLGVLVPVVGIFQVGCQAYADRFTYLPQLGILWALAWGLVTLFQSRRVVLCAALGILTVAMSALAVQQVGFWKDTATLFEQALAVTNENAIAAEIAGIGRAKRGEFPQAIVHYREAKRLMPRNAEVRGLLGEALTHTGESQQAAEELYFALTLNPADEHVRNNLNALLLSQEAAR